MKIEELDLSYSGLVNLIDGNSDIAYPILKCILQGCENKKVEISTLEHKIKQEQGNLNHYLGAIDKICKHLKYSHPLSFVFDGIIYAVNEKLEIKTFPVTNAINPVG